MNEAMLRVPSRWVVKGASSIIATPSSPCSSSFVDATSAGSRLSLNAEIPKQVTVLASGCLEYRKALDSSRLSLLVYLICYLDAVTLSRYTVH